MATAQQLVIVSCEDRKKKNITRSPSSPGDTVRCCIRKQEAGQNEFVLTDMHTQLVHAHTHQQPVLTRAHAITCSTSLCSCPSRSCAPPLSRQNIYSTWNLPRNRGETSALPWLAELPSNRVCLSSQSGALTEAHWPNETDYSEARAGTVTW